MEKDRPKPEAEPVKARITWKGGGEDDNTEIVIFRGVKYERGKPLESEDPELIAKANGNQYFDVEMLEGEMPVTKEEVNPPPSRQSAQGPVVKHGEPPELAHGKPPSPPGKPEDSPGKPGTGAPGQEKKPQVNPLLKK